MSEEVLKLAALRRVATQAGALRFNKAVGQIIGKDTATDPSISRAATLQRLLSLYNRMRAAKLYGQEDKFRAASAEMADAIESYGKKSPSGAKRLREVVEKLSFAEEEARRKKVTDTKAGAE